MRGAVFAALLVLFSASFTVPLSAEPFPSIAPIVNKVLPAVVGIETTGMREDPLHGGSREVKGAGSGFIIDPQGVVVTANHVITEATKIEVVFNDERRARAEVVGSDDTFDIAVLKIVGDRKDFPTVPFGNSELIQVGEWVFAIGNPFALLNSVSVGVISGKRWAVEGPTIDGISMAVQLSYLQTDAAINRGNSGGPLFNFGGEVIGLNVAILSPSPSGGSVGVGFAIPSNFIRLVALELQSYHRFRRGWFGIIGPLFLTEENAPSLGAPLSHGMLLGELYSGGPAEKSGFKPGDIVLSWNGKEIRTQPDIEMAILLSPVGSTATIQVFRDGKVIEIRMPMQEARRP